MDRLNQLRGAAGGSGDSTLDTTSPPSEAFMSANESSSKYFSLSEVDSSFDISPIKDVSLASATADSDTTITEDDLIPNLSPVRKKSDILDSYKIGKQIEAANILSGGVDIFDDNDNSYDGDELVIDDNIELDEKTNSEIKQDSVDFKSDIIESTLIDEDTYIAGKDTEVVLQIDGKNLDAIDIGNRLYLYRKEGEEELAAVQIIEDEKQQTSFKFLKVRENAEGNLEVYEEIEVEIQKEVPAKEGKSTDKNTSHVPIRDINKVINDNASNKVADKTNSPQIEPTTPSTNDVENELKDGLESKSEVNLNGKMVKFSESRKSPVIGSFAYHSTPSKEGKPLTKTMVDLQLHPSRHSDNIKKTIEVHTDNCKQKVTENQTKHKDFVEEKEPNTLSTENKESIVIEGKSEEDVNTEKKLNKSENISLKGNVTNILDTTDVNMSECNQPTEITEQHDQGNVAENTGNNIFETESLENFDKVIISDSNNDNISQNDGLQEENTMENDKPIEQGESAADVSKTDISEEDILSNEDKVGSHNKCETFEIPQETLCSQNDQTQDNVEQDNKTEPIRDHTYDASAVEKEVPKENNSLNIAKKSSVPKDNETINLDNDLKENNVVKNITKLKNVISETNKTCSKIFKEDNELKLDIGQIITKEIDKDKIEEAKCKDIIGQYIKESCVYSKENVENREICSSSNSTLLLQSDIQNKSIEANNYLELSVTEKSVQLNDKSSCEQNHLIVKSNESVTSTVEKPSSDCNNIIHPKEENDVFAEEKILDKTKENTLFVMDDKATESENMKAESVFESNPFKSREDTHKKSDCEVSAQIETNLELECNETEKDVKINDDDSKSMNNNSAVPFGKWTEANRQEFLNKIKGSKTLVNSSNNKAIKNSNDLNRRDVLKKIDSQRHTSTAAKVQDLSKINVKSEVVFTNKPVTVVEETTIPNAVTSQESKIPIKAGVSTSMTKEITFKNSMKQDITRKPLAMSAKITSTVTSVTKKETVQRKAVKDLIDKTIEGMIIKAFPTKPTSTETKTSDCNAGKLPTSPSTTLDAIEMKMNELHGIPFIERPPHELPKVHNPVPQNYVNDEQEKAPDNKPTKVPKLSLIKKNSQEKGKDNILEVDSEEEVIEHEPVTGDIEIKHDLPSNLSLNENPIKTDTLNTNKDNTKKEPVITEKDFDKFARRNSVTYENCLKVNFEKLEPPNVVNTVIEMDKASKSHSKNEITRIEYKQNRPSKIQNININKHPSKSYSSTKLSQVVEDPSNKNYHSKLQIAYQSALTAKRQLSCPIDIIEDQPVKVVFMDTKTEFVPNLLNIQGQKLSPSEKRIVDDTNPISTNDCVNSELMDTVDEGKPQDDIKVKTKHQRKQVLTPVEAPELELIEPRDLGIDVSPKKKRKTDDNKTEKISKNVVHKKSYLLGRTVIEDKVVNTQHMTNNELKLLLNRDEETVSKDTATAIDSLVKAAELLENQSETMNSSTISNPDSIQSTTPVKRGRGRPRKYPLPDGTMDKTKVPSPQKKPRLIDAKPNKRETEDEESSDDGEIKENWTMGKINENIVCPICSKLFRSENVIFKHVKHCSGPSPNRSDTSKRSIRKDRRSRESDDKSHESQDEMDVDEEKSFEDKEDTRAERKSKDSINTSKVDKDVIVIEDTPVKEKPKKHTGEKHHESRLTNRNKIQNTSSSNLECEFCGKTFRQLSYLANHKLHHVKENTKKVDKSSEISNKSIFSCDICNKEFRKLHHLAQHRIIHNPSSIPTKLSRKNSSERGIDSSDKEEISKQSEDPSAGFRCEPCDKSFRKLHHLVEHRETHDGINRQKVTCPEQVVAEKPIPPPQCDICKKTFRKLHHLIEHKEQHVETSSEKSDDKSVKSSLSTKDIIHECSLCYMVFPNEHSLNKHTIICQRKKRQSKLPKPVNGEECENVETNNFKAEENKIDDGDEPEIILDEVKVINLEKDDDNSDIDLHTSDIVIAEKETPFIDITEHHPQTNIDDKKFETLDEPIIMRDEATDVNISKVEDLIAVKEQQDQINEKGIESIQVNPKNKTLPKDKAVPVVTKRQKKFNVVLPTVNENELLEETSDDEVRYMLNPDYKPDDTSEDKLFMKVKAKKRNSLQIERPNSKELIKRRTSLQHPPKIPRLKSKSVENKTMIPSASSIKNIPKTSKPEPTPGTESDDSDVKYSFPVKTPKPTTVEHRVTEKRPQRKSLEEKRKSLSGIAKRKSLGKATGGTVSKVKQSPVKQIKRRTTNAEHRCDCGQLFSSAALLSRHTSLAHTPPRIRKRRSPPPDIDNKTLTKRAIPKPSDKTKQSVAASKTSVRSDANSSVPKPNQPTKSKEVKSSDTRKSTKPTEKAELVKSSNIGKLRRSGVPAPEKRKTLYQKGKI